jgi:DNA-binding transcriptional ArsR family regulator
MSAEVLVLDEPERAQALLDRTRIEILGHLGEPLSAVELSRRMSQPRQRLNYHLRELEARGLIERVDEKRRGNVSLRTYRRSGTCYAISNSALGALGSTPERVRDRFSSAYQIAVASQAIDDLAKLRAGADAAGKALATLTLEVDVRFADATARNAFADELSDAVAALAAKYHDATAPSGRTFKLYVGAYPRPHAAASGS